MAPKILVVFGATGAQGGSVVRSVLSDPELSQQYAIRAVTRDPSKADATELSALGVEVVRGDLNDGASVVSACTGAHTIFGNTVSEYDAPIEKEYNQGKLLADTAVSCGAQFFIWSTLPVTKKVSGGKYTKIVHFDVKGHVENYIRSLPIKSAFFSPGTFMSNFATFMAPRPSWNNDGTYVLSGPHSPETKFPLLDTVSDTGKWVRAILSEPKRYEGKMVVGSSGLVSQAEMVEIFSRVTGKTVKYMQVDGPTFASYIPGRGDEVVEMQLYFQDFGYWGADTQELIEWSMRQARGRLISFEEYISQVNPVKLE